MKIEQLMRPDLQDEYGILKLQNIILNIMKYIHDLCDKHQIQYYVIGGTALGAVRHGGFIPWDDDLDIAMTRDNYDKFIQVCQDELDPNEFYLQVGRKDWPLYFSKLRLKGTLFDEEGVGDEIAEENRGIFIDIFPFDATSNNRIVRYWQYFCSRLLVANAVGSRGYKTNSLCKKMVILMTKPLNNKLIRDFFYYQTIKYNSKKTKYFGDLFDCFRLRDASWPQEIWGTPTKVIFETLELYAPASILEYLKEYYGNYQELPSEDNRVPRHLECINYGVYK